MSKAEILAEISKLTPEDRDEIRQKLDEFDGDLTAEEIALIDTRMEEHRRDPSSAVPIDQLKSLLRAEFPR